MQIDSEHSKTIPGDDSGFSSPPFPIPSFYYDWQKKAEDDEINLLDYGRMLYNHKLKIACFTLLLTLITFWISSKSPKLYQAEVALTPISSGRGGLSALLTQANSIPVIGSQLAGLGGNDQQTQQFKNILNSRTLIEGVIEDLHLMPVLFENQWDVSKNNWKYNNAEQIPRIEDGVGVIQSKVLKVAEDKKTGLLKIVVTFKDPQLTASIANHFVVRLQDYITTNNLTTAKRNRQFIEIQLQKNKVDFLEFSKKLSEFYTNNRISSVQSTINVDVGKSEILPKTFEEFRQHLSILEQQKERSDAHLLRLNQKGVVENVPAQVYLQYVTLQRELLTNTNALLMQQYELAKIEESKEDLAFQVIDKALVPRGPSFPKVRQNTLIAFIGGLFFSIFLTFSIEHFRKLSENKKLPLKTLK